MPHRADSPPSLAGEPWFRDPDLVAVLAALDGDGEEVRIVGGAVRNALMGVPIGDIDIATTATPDVVTRRAVAAGLKAVPTGIEHGTVTVVSGRHAFEVTTLRQDVETHGRHATVVFGRDWVADAHRRDFAMNALYLDRTGHVFDPVGGYADILVRRVRFIGDAATRISEDYLRILRFFRFHAAYGEGDPDRPGLLAAIRLRAGLRVLSAERIGVETRRLVTARRAPETIEVMAEAGILEIVFAGVVRIGAFARLRAIADANGVPASPGRALAVAGCFVEEDGERIADRLRLKNADREEMVSAVRLARAVRRDMPAEGVRALLYRAGRERVGDAVLAAWAFSGDGPQDAGWRALLDMARREAVPVFAIKGADALDLGMKPGRGVGRLIAALEAWWIAENFRPDAAALKARLAEMVAAEKAAAK
ncbi:MAG TPA: CCA tRNA nucleotidyltransferase [Kaistiaceae bacterium]|nr:CCA tRNA nucleotidyltransferase [Kaistiaceae bacterium]